MPCVDIVGLMSRMWSKSLGQEQGKVGVISCQSRPTGNSFVA
jgi:hypothetical protein